MAKNPIGNWAYIIGGIVVVIAGIGSGVGAAWAANAWLGFILVVLGLTIGFVNIAKKEVVPFLVAAVALVIVGGAASLGNIDPVVPIVGSVLQGIVNFSILLVAPAALVVALKAAYDLASEE